MLGLKFSSESKLFGEGPSRLCATSATLKTDNIKTISKLLVDQCEEMRKCRILACWSESSAVHIFCKRLNHHWSRAGLHRKMAVDCLIVITSIVKTLFLTIPDQERGIIGPASLLHSWHWVLSWTYFIVWKQNENIYRILNIMVEQERLG